MSSRGQNEFSIFVLLSEGAKYKNFVTDETGLGTPLPPGDLQARIGFLKSLLLLSVRSVGVL